MFKYLKYVRWRFKKSYELSIDIRLWTSPNFNKFHWVMRQKLRSQPELEKKYKQTQILSQLMANIRRYLWGFSPPFQCIVYRNKRFCTQHLTSTLIQKSFFKCFVTSENVSQLYVFFNISFTETECKHLRHNLIK